MQFDDSGISALIPPSAASQAAVTLGSMNLHPVIPVQKPSRSPSPVVKDDYCDMDWSSRDVSAQCEPLSQIKLT